MPVMRVLHVSSGNLYGGVETLLVTLARSRHLCSSMEPHFALSFEGRLSEELRAEGVPVSLLGPVRTRKPWTIWQARGRLETLLLQRNYDAVVCHMVWPMAIFGSVPLHCGIPLAFWAHDLPDGRHWLERWARRYRPNFVLVNSKFTDTAVDRLYSQVPRDVVYYPVALRQLQDANARANVRKDLNAGDDTVVIIQVSRMQAWKGHELHLQALSRLNGIPQKWVCWMVGGPQRPEEHKYIERLKTTAAQLGVSDRVKFLGQRSDVPQLLAAADIFCQPNQGPEPFGIVFIEALGAGLPVVSTALGAAQEIIDERCGLLAPPNDPAGLAQMLQRFIEAPAARRTAAIHSRDRARKLCDPAQQLNCIDSRLRSLAFQSKGPAEKSCLALP